MATIHNLETRRERDHQELTKREFADRFLWPAYDAVVDSIEYLPDWMLLRIMSECRRRLGR